MPDILEIEINLFNKQYFYVDKKNKNVALINKDQLIDNTAHFIAFHDEQNSSHTSFGYFGGKRLYRVNCIYKYQTLQDIMKQSIIIVIDKIDLFTKVKKLLTTLSLVMPFSHNNYIDITGIDSVLLNTVLGVNNMYYNEESYLS